MNKKFFDLIKKIMEVLQNPLAFGFVVFLFSFGYKKVFYEKKGMTDIMTESLLLGIISSFTMFMLSSDFSSIQEPILTEAPDF